MLRIYIVVVECIFFRHRFLPLICSFFMYLFFFFFYHDCIFINFYSNTVHKFPVYGTIKLYCIVLYCIALHCIALHCIALHCIALHCIALHCIALYEAGVPVNLF